MTEISLREQLLEILSAYEAVQQQALREAQQRIDELEQENADLLAQLAEDETLADIVEDDELRKRITSLHSSPLDTVIREAGVILENRLRIVGKAGTDAHGAGLVDEVFMPKKGTLIFSEHPGEQDGVRMLYRGAIQFIRNPPMHRLIEYPESTAHLFVRLLDILLQIISEKETQQKTPPPSGHRKWTAPEFFEALSKRVDAHVVDRVKDLYAWSKKEADRVWFGTGRNDGSFTFHYLRDRRTISIFTIYTNGDFVLNYGWLSKSVEPELMTQFHQKLTAIPSFSHTHDDFSTWPRVKVSRVAEDFAQFEAAILWLKDRIDGRQ